MPTMTPKLCAEAADRAIGTYITECGAYGDATKVASALEMLTAKCALGYGHVTSQCTMMDMLMRMAVHCGQRMEDEPKGMVQ
jgi:hypothetical protein